MLHVSDPTTLAARKPGNKLQRLSILTNGILILLIVFALQRFSLSWFSPFHAHAMGTAKAATAAGPTDGQGLYEGCRLDTVYQQCLDHLTQIAEGGFSLVLNYEALSSTSTELVDYLNQASSLHLKIILALNNTAWWDNSQPARSVYPVLASSCANDPSYAPCSDDTTFLNYIIHLVSGLSGLWGYYVGDEVQPEHFAQLKSFTDKIKAADKTHPRLFVAGTPTGIATINTDLVRLTSEPDFPSADIATVIAQDFYPIGSYPVLPVNGTSTIAPQLRTVRMNNGGNNGSVDSYGMVLQAHSFLPYPGYGCGTPPMLQLCPYPTISQMQTMLNNTLQNAQPRLVLWYSFFDIMRSGYPDYHWANTITAAGFNAIQNPSFEPLSSSWIWRNSGPGSSATGTAAQVCTTMSSPLDASCMAHVHVTSADPNHNWYVSFHQAGIPLTSGKKTYISFDAMSPDGGTVQLVLDNDTTYQSYYAQWLALTTSWTHYSFTFDNAQFTDPNALFTLSFADHVGNVFINDVVITTPS